MLTATDVYTARWESGAQVTATLYDQMPCEDKARRIWLSWQNKDGQVQAWVLSPHEAVVITQALAHITERALCQEADGMVKAADEKGWLNYTVQHPKEQADEEAEDGKDGVTPEAG